MKAAKTPEYVNCRVSLYPHFQPRKKHNNPQMSFLITKKAEYVGQ